MDPVTAVFILLLFFGLMRYHRDKKVIVEQTIMPSGIFPYVKKDLLLSNSEHVFYQTLQSVVGNQYHILLKVGIDDLIMVKKNISKSAKAAYLQKITGKCADFVLCKPENLEIMAVILLEGHQKFVDRAFQAAALPLIRFKPNYTYNKQEMTTMLSSLMNHG